MKIVQVAWVQAGVYLKRVVCAVVGALDGVPSGTFISYETCRCMQTGAVYPIRFVHLLLLLLGLLTLCTFTISLLSQRLASLCIRL